MGRLALKASSAVFWAGLLDGMEIKQAEGNHSPDSDHETKYFLFSPPDFL